MRENHNIPPKESEAASTAEAIPEGVSLSKMSKPPAFQFYANDFTDATKFWPANAVGLFIRCLCTQWTHGGLPGELRTIARGHGMDFEEFEQAWKLVSSKFERGEDGLLRNSRLERVRMRQVEVSKARSNAGIASAIARTNVRTNDGTKNEQRKVKEKEKIEGEIQGREPAREIAWPSWAGEKTRSTWEDFKAYRKTEKKDPIRSAQSEQRAVNLLAKYYTTGQECVEALEECMGRGWLFPVNPAKLNSRSSPPSQPPPSPTAKPWIG